MRVYRFTNQISVVLSTHQEVVGGQNDEEAVEVLPELLPHEDCDGAHVGRHADDGHHEEERREHAHAAVTVIFVVFELLVLGADDDGTHSDLDLRSDCIAFEERQRPRLIEDALLAALARSYPSLEQLSAGERG